MSGPGPTQTNRFFTVLVLPLGAWVGGGTCKSKLFCFVYDSLSYRIHESLSCQVMLMVMNMNMLTSVETQSNQLDPAGKNSPLCFFYFYLTLHFFSQWQVQTSPGHIEQMSDACLHKCSGTIRPTNCFGHCLGGTAQSCLVPWLSSFAVLALLWVNIYW